MKQAIILVVDDEQTILDIVSAYLRAEGYRVQTALDGLEGLKKFRRFQPDLIVLDIMLPKLDGLELLEQIRAEASNVYIIMLTAKAEEMDKVLGLSLGADDYLTKPFSTPELIARIKAGLRRYSQEENHSQSDILTFRHLRIDPQARRVWRDDQEISLTPLEFDLLHTLAEHQGWVLSREQLLERVWGSDFYGDERVIDTHLGRIRKKIERDPANPEFIVTVRGIGYRFEAELI